MDKDIYIIKKALARYTIAETKAITRMLDRVEPPSQGAYQKLDERVTEIREDNKPHLTFKKAIAILIAATLLIACLSVGAYAISEKINIGGFWVEWFEGHLKLTSQGAEDVKSTVENVRISYIPENYNNTISDVTSKWGVYKWENGTDYIQMDISVAYGEEYFINTEGNNYTVVNIGDYVVQKTEYESAINSFWTDGKISYYICCTNLPWEEMVKIIEGISYEE